MAKAGRRRIWLRILLVLVIVLLVCPVITIFVIRWRTTTAWETFRDHWEAQGEKFALEDHIPGPIPDEQNLATHPLFVGLNVEDSNSQPWTEQIDVTKLRGYDAKSSRPRKELCENADFAGWRSIPAVATPEERLAAIRTLLEPMNEPLDGAAAALEERPLCRYELDWEDTYRMSTSQVFTFLRLAQAFGTRATVRLASGDSAGATRDIISTHQIAEAGGRDPHMIGALVGFGGHALALNSLWGGLDRGAFTDADLQDLDAVLAALDPFPERLLPALRMERAMLLHLLDELEGDPKGTRDMLASREIGGTAGFVFRMWMSASRLGASEDLQEAVLAPRGTAVTRPDWRAFEEWEKRLERRWSGRRKFVEVFASLATPALAAAGRKAYLLEADLAHARIAIALERHRLATGSYPAALAGLVPAFLPALPEDRINGRPIEYRLQPGGTPLIYQWGFDGDDDGGTPRKDPRHGDLVWQYSLPPGFTGREWRRKD